MFDISSENPYRYKDYLGDEYEFYIFTANDGSRHFSIKVRYYDSKKSIPIFGYEVLGHSFALPLDGETILWDAYKHIPNDIRGESISEEVRRLADKIFKLKAFL